MAKKKKKKRTRPDYSDIDLSKVDFSKPLEDNRKERFCQEYHKTLNGTQSYMTLSPNVKKTTAESNSSTLLKHPLVAGRIAYLQSVLSDDCGVDARKLMEEWKKIGFANAKQIVGSGNTIKNIASLPDDVGAAISSVAVSKTKQGKNVKVTFHSKEAALENMGKRIGWYEKHQAQVVDGLTEMFKEIQGSGTAIPINDG